MKTYKVILDTMGYENDLSHSIKAAREFSLKHNDIKIILCGDAQLIKTHFIKENEFEILDAKSQINQDDTVFSARRKNDSSMHIALKHLKENDDIDGMLSAGNTAVFVMLAYNIIGLLEHIKKPAFMPFIPTIDGIGFNLLDVGASIDVDGFDLYNFAIMANVIAKQRIDNPSIGVLNIGTEKHKGLKLHQEANEILLNSDLNYKGFIEPRNILKREVDILLCDGFSGNIALKTMEGTAKTLADFLKQEYKKPKNMLGGLLSKAVFKKMKNIFDYKKNAGAFVLGFSKILVKTHGSADEMQFYSSLELLYKTIKSDVMNQIKQELKKVYEIQ